VANDVVFSLGRILDKTTASSGAWIFNNRVDTTNGFKALNDSVFQLKLIRPFHPIMGILSMQYCSLVPKEIVENLEKISGEIPAEPVRLNFKPGQKDKH
jgi:oligopeptide transport system substrate-binding protein